MDELVAKKKSEISSLVNRFCEKYLNGEYRSLCEKVILKLSRKRHVLFLTGKVEIWASAVVWCIARINFLFDKNNKYYLTGDDICNYFGTRKSTVGQKASLIEKTLKIKLFDENFCTQELIENSPFRNLIMINGLIVPKDLFE